MVKACPSSCGLMLKYRILAYVGQAAYGGEVHTLFGWGNTERKKPLGRPGHIWELNMKWILKNLWEDVDWLVWVRTGTSGGFLWARWWTFRPIKMWGMSWLGVEVFVFSRRALLPVGIYMYFHCYLVTSEMKDAGTQDILIMRSFTPFIQQIDSMANYSIMIKVYGDRSAWRMCGVAYGFNFRFSLQFDIVWNCLFLRIQIFLSCFVSVPYYHLDFRNMQGIPHIGLCSLSDGSRWKSDSVLVWSRLIWRVGTWYVV